MDKIFRPLKTTNFGNYQCAIKLAEIINESRDVKIKERISHLINTYYWYINDLSKLGHSYNKTLELTKNDFIERLNESENLPLKIITFTKNVLTSIYKEKLRK